MLSLPSTSAIQKHYAQDQMTLFSSRLLPLHSSHSNLFSLDNRMPSFMSKSRQNDLVREPTKLTVPPSTSNPVYLSTQEKDTTEPKKKLFGFNLDCSFPTRPRRGLKSDRSAYNNSSVRNLKKTPNELDSSILLNLGAMTERNTQLSIQKEIKKVNGILHMPSKSVEKFKEYFEQSLEEANKKRAYQRPGRSVVNVSSESQSNPFASSSNIQYTDDALVTEPLQIKREDSTGKKNLLKHITHASLSSTKEQKSLQGSFEGLKRDTPLLSSKLLTPSRDISNQSDSEYISQKIRIRELLNQQVNKSHRFPSGDLVTNNNILIMEEASKDQFSERKELLPGLKLSQMRKSIQSQRNGSLSENISLEGNYSHKKITAPVSPLELLNEEPETARTSGNQSVQNRPILRQRPVKVKSSRCIENTNLESARKMVTFQLKRHKDFREVVNDLYRVDENNLEVRDISAL